MSEEEEDTIKLILLGNSGVGKTSLIKSIMGVNPNKTEESTLSAYYLQKSFTLENKEYIVDLWDTAGQEKYRSLAKVFYKNASVCILVYEITRRASFEELKKYWIGQVTNNASKNISK
jgi:small GTP-binding protein